MCHADDSISAEPPTVRFRSRAQHVGGLRERLPGTWIDTKPDPATEVVALRIMEIGERGARTPTTIYWLAIEEFRDGR